jgi:hypothetical protein
MKRSIYDTGDIATIKLLLRRTLVRSVTLFGKPTPSHLQNNHSLSLPLQGGDVLQSTSISRVFIPSVEGQQQLLIRKNLKGVGFVLPFSLFSFSSLSPNMDLVSLRFRNSAFNFKLNDNQSLSKIPITHKWNIKKEA